MASQYPAYGGPSAQTLTDDASHSYPPTYGHSSGSTLTSPAKEDKQNDIIARDLARTPSPTPSEARELKTGAIDWKSITNWRFWIRREWLWYYVALVLILVITALMTIYHKQIVQWLTPATNWLHDLRFGWLVPIGILFVISFPPLFGHEIVAVLCGLVWGLWIGFGIVAAGTFLGEVGNFYAFKYCCRSRGEKLERTKIGYACLAKVVRDGGFRIALIARLSAIPGHFTTAVFSACGMGIFVFSLAAILSMPKQFITVYLGVILEQSESGTTDKKSQIISRVVLAITVLITVAAMWYILRQMNKVKPEIIYAKRKARQAKMVRAQLPYGNPEAMTSEGTLAEDVETADATVPLTSPRQNDKKPSFSPMYAPQAQRNYDYDYNSYARETDIGADQQHLTHRPAWSHQPLRDDMEDGGYDDGRTPLPPGIPGPPGATLTHPRMGEPSNAHQQPSGSYQGQDGLQVPGSNEPRPESRSDYIITFDPNAAASSSHSPSPYYDQPHTYPYSSANPSQPPISPFDNGSLQASKSTPNLQSTAAVEFSPSPHVTYTPKLPGANPGAAYSNNPYMQSYQPPAQLSPSSAPPPPLPSYAAADNAASAPSSNPYYVMKNAGSTRGVSLTDGPAPSQSNNPYLSMAGHGQEETTASYHTAWGSEHSREASPNGRDAGLR
ncbi:hypothetical protein HGRIS_010957 [Hohenbuehelia grisea]|uniref:Golgi apparatus membrane protein TVP38 n=1 Tax=Hohenbuehelia grisea TaxID=104357 RepID=A0ABR3IYU3_9AGAR